LDNIDATGPFHRFLPGSEQQWPGWNLWQWHRCPGLCRRDAAGSEPGTLALLGLWNSGTGWHHTP
jgi:hypothetical protein